MPQENLWKHHHHKKNRKSDDKNQKMVNFFDKAMLPISLIWPMMMLPQVFKIYSTKDASSIAIVSRIMFIFSASFWIIYGRFHKDKPIVFSNVAWLIIYFLIITWAILY